MKFLVGEGGVGKTRLAAEFGRALRSKGWDAGMVRLERAQNFAFANKAVLLIVNYPEEQVAAVKALLTDLARLEVEVTLRVLFLTRRPMGSWIDIVTQCRANTVCDLTPIVLGPVDVPAAHVLYSSALERASENWGTTPLPLSQEALAYWLSDAPENARTLFTVATVIYSALHPNEQVVTYKGSEIVSALAAREALRLAAISKDHGLAPNSLATLLTTTAVAGDLDKAKIERLADLGDAETLVRAATAAGHWSGQEVPAPTPDIVAAELLVRNLTEAGKSAPEIIWQGIGLDDALTAIGRFGRLSYDAEVVLGRLDTRLGDFLEEALRGNRERC